MHHSPCSRFRYLNHTIRTETPGVVQPESRSLGAVPRRGVQNPAGWVLRTRFLSGDGLQTDFRRSSGGSGSVMLGITNYKGQS